MQATKYNNILPSYLYHLKEGDGLFRQYTLMHRDTKVCNFNICPNTDFLIDIDTINKEHLPLNCVGAPNHLLTPYLTKWWSLRNIPYKRYSKLPLGNDNMSLFIANNLALSLSDCYWIKPFNSNLTWDEVNLFDNPFNSHLSEYLNNQNKLDTLINLSRSPELTSNGELSKWWIIQNGKSYLIKTGTHPYYYEPINEVLACDLGLSLGFNYLEYSLYSNNPNCPLSICPNMLFSGQELVPASLICSLLEKDSKENYLNHYLKCIQHWYESFNMTPPSNLIDSILEVLLVDYIIVNTDRHLYNFGFIRNSLDLRPRYICPVYDSGTSMWCFLEDNLIGNDNLIKPKVFASNFGELYSLLEKSDITVPKHISFASVVNKYHTLLSNLNTISEYRIHHLTESLEHRIQQIFSGNTI